MFQVFESFEPGYINRLINLNKVFLVTQSYPSGNFYYLENVKTGILLSDYDDKGLARIHLAAVKDDAYASVIDLKNEKHLQKLNEMLRPDSTYQLYWSVIKDGEALKKLLKLKYKDIIRNYITKNTTWRIGGNETLRVQLNTIFGVIFIILKYGSQELRIKFEDLEIS